MDTPHVAPDHAALLTSPDPKLAANKKLVYDMYRIVLQAGLWRRAGEFIRDDYVQHNPNAGQGLAGVQDYIRKTRPERPIANRLELPLINLIAEGDYVMTAFVSDPAQRRCNVGDDGARRRMMQVAALVPVGFDCLGHKPMPRCCWSLHGRPGTA